VSNSISDEIAILGFRSCLFCVQCDRKQFAAGRFVYCNSGAKRISAPGPALYIEESTGEGLHTRLQRDEMCFRAKSLIPTLGVQRH